jgi:hypothetical protein
MPALPSCLRGEAAHHEPARDLRSLRRADPPAAVGGAVHPEGEGWYVTDYPSEPQEGE